MHAQRNGRAAVAFTVIELMLSVAILGVIVFALYAVFNQTQRALRNTQTQGDVSEKARAILDIVSRELEQAHATFSVSRVTNGAVVSVQQEINLTGGFETAQGYLPITQQADRKDVTPRTNFLHSLFFYTHHTNAWQGIGYRVNNTSNRVGVLQRYEVTQFAVPPTNNVFPSGFLSASFTNASYHHIADGVVHMAFIPYDSQGRRLGFDTTNRSPDAYKIYRATAAGSPIPQWSDTTVTNQANVRLIEGYTGARAETMQYASRFSFHSNALPAFVDMEFAILEPETLAQYYNMLQDQNPNAANFLARQVSKVHLFRQRIPIRTASQ